MMPVSTPLRRRSGSRIQSMTTKVMSVLKVMTAALYRHLERLERSGDL
jgi:hypothetical protein